MFGSSSCDLTPLCLAQLSRFETGQTSVILALVADAAQRASWSPDGSTANARPALLISASLDCVCGYELPLRTSGLPCACRMRGHTLTVRALATCGLPGRLPGAASRVCLSGGDDGSVRIWSLRDGAQLGSSRGGVAAGAPVHSLRALSGDGRAAAALESGDILLLRSLADARGTTDWHRERVVSAGRVHSVACFSSFLLSTGADQRLSVWSIDHEAHHPQVIQLPCVVAQLLVAPNGLHGVAEDGQYLFWACSDSSHVITSPPAPGWGPPLARIFQGPTPARLPPPSLSS